MKFDTNEELARYVLEQWAKGKQVWLREEGTSDRWRVAYISNGFDLSLRGGKDGWRKSNLGSLAGYEIEFYDADLSVS